MKMVNSQELKDLIAVSEVDVDESRDAAIEHGITNIPNVIAFKNGKAVANQLGFVPEEQTEAFIKSVL